MAKVALILHGWPQHRAGGHFLSGFFRGKGYRVITPDLFGRSFTFSPGAIHQEIKEELDSQRPEVIVGISLGGLVLPYIAKDYPESKLVFVASGPYLKAKPALLDFFLRANKHQVVLNLAETVLKSPNWLLALIYKLTNPFNGTLEEREEYEEDMYQNIKFIKGIPVSKELEIARFVVTTDNSGILGSLKNKTLIFNGRRDLFMPAERGQELHKLLEQSRLIINEGEHFNSFTGQDLLAVEDFLQE
jgi:pimeloyl-ACP methyl ester carboxylesterase